MDNWSGGHAGIVPRRGERVFEKIWASYDAGALKPTEIFKVREGVELHYFAPRPARFGQQRSPSLYPRRRLEGREPERLLPMEPLSRRARGFCICASSTGFWIGKTRQADDLRGGCQSAMLASANAENWVSIQRVLPSVEILRALILRQRWQRLKAITTRPTTSRSIPCRTCCCWALRLWI